MNKDYSLALKFTAKTSEVARKVRGLGRDIDTRLSTSNSRVLRGVGKIANAFSFVGSSVVRVGGVIGGAFVGGLRMAFGWVGRIARGLRGLPMAGLKLLAVGSIGVFGAHKALSPAGEMERYSTQLDVMKKSHLYDFLTKASAGKPFQMGESVQAGVLMEAFKISSKKYLSTVMDAAAGFKKPLQEIVRMLGYARSGRTGEAIESAGNIGITRSDLKKFGIRFEKSGAVVAATAGKLMNAMIGLMKNRFGGMASRIGTGTYEGAVSDMKDSIFRAFANAGKKFLPFATKIVRDVSGTISSVGKHLAGLPWDKWGAKLSSGVRKAGNIIDNLMDSKKRAEITKAISGGWNNIKGDMPKFGKALVLDLVDAAANASAPKISSIFSSAFESGGKLLGILIADPLINVWNMVWTGITSFAKTIAFTIADAEAWIAKKLPFVDPDNVDRVNKKDKARMEVNHANLLLKGLIKTNTEKTMEKWKGEMAKFGTADGSMPRTKALINSIRERSGIDKIVKTLTAPKKFDPISLSLFRRGGGAGGNGYINGQAMPLSKEQLAGNAAMRKLAEILPDMFRVKKEADVFGRELKQFMIDLKSGANSRNDSTTLQDILRELRKLNNAVGG